MKTSDLPWPFKSPPPSNETKAGDLQGAPFLKTRGFLRMGQPPRKHLVGMCLVFCGSHVPRAMARFIMVSIYDLCCELEHWAAVALL